MTEKNKALRGLVTTVSCVLFALVCVALTGCAKSDEEEIRTVITESMSLLQNPTEEGLSPYIDESKVDLTTLDSNGIDFYEFLSFCFKKLDYSIDEIVIDGKDATAKLTITNVDLRSASQAASAEITNNLGNYTDTLSGENAQKEIITVFMQRFYSQLSRSSQTVTEEAELSFKKNDGAWEVDPDSVISMIESMVTSVEL